MGGPRVGDPAPPFEATDQAGRTVRLADLRGRWVVLYFYPMDGTAGCTAEACGFRDDTDAWQETGAVVVGVSTQGVESHRRFAGTHRLPFPLLADEDKAVCRAYGALGLTGLARRVTYLIGPDGRIVQAWRLVLPGGHSRAVLAALRSAQAGHAAAPSGEGL